MCPLFYCVALFTFKIGDTEGTVSSSCGGGGGGGGGGGVGGGGDLIPSSFSTSLLLCCMALCSFSASLCSWEVGML